LTVISSVSAIAPTEARTTVFRARDGSFRPSEIGTGNDAALTAALNEIDAALARDFAKADTGPPEAFVLASRIDDIINSQAASGKLTGDQADALRSLLAIDESDGTVAGPDEDQNDFAMAEDADVSDSGDPILVFLRQVQDAQASFRGYAPNGTANSALALTWMLFNKRA
jgi:hypothetical protein